MSDEKCRTEKNCQKCEIRGLQKFRLNMLAMLQYQNEKGCNNFLSDIKNIKK